MFIFNNYPSHYFFYNAEVMYLVTKEILLSNKDMYSIEKGLEALLDHARLLKMFLFSMDIFITYFFGFPIYYFVHGYFFFSCLCNVASGRLLEHGRLIFFKNLRPWPTIKSCPTLPTIG